MADSTSPSARLDTTTWDATPDRAEVIRLRDALAVERRKAELQAGLLRRTRGEDDPFTEEAARRAERLAAVLEINK